MRLTLDKVTQTHRPDKQGYNNYDLWSTQWNYFFHWLSFCPVIWHWSHFTIELLARSIYVHLHIIKLLFLGTFVRGFFHILSIDIDEHQTGQGIHILFVIVCNENLLNFWLSTYFLYQFAHANAVVIDLSKYVFLEFNMNVVM